MNVRIQPGATLHWVHARTGRLCFLFQLLSFHLLLERQLLQMVQLQLQLQQLLMLVWGQIHRIHLKQSQIVLHLKNVLLPAVRSITDERLRDGGRRRGMLALRAVRLGELLHSLIRLLLLAYHV